MSEIELHSRVALANGADEVYAFALSGTEGWVRGHKKDEDGFEMVKIEWDKDHWRYNGQSDGWTFESHFDVVGPPEPPQEVEEDEDEEQEIVDPPATNEQMEEYMEALTQAMEAASEGDGFIMITIRKQPNPENPEEMMYVPSIHTQSVNPETAALLDIQLMECAAQTYEETVLALMQKFKP